jgi:hypothetical protein
MQTGVLNESPPYVAHTIKGPPLTPALKATKYRTVLNKGFEL